jgi:ubiquitin carboxyl-terminal hydrolase 40
MNSALQVLFMNPLFRQIIYDLPLCEGEDITKPSQFIESPEMYRILIAFQKLFIQLEKYKIRAVTTKELTEAFNWSSSDGTVQHDSQEFIRIITETLDNILVTTQFNGLVNNLFRLVNFSSKTCSNCGKTSTSEEISLDIQVPVRNRKGLLDSLDSLYNSYEIIEGYNCSGCNKTVDLKRGNKLSFVPQLLNLSLNKMDFDYNTFERIKITSKFDFPLELDMRPFLTEDIKNTLGLEETQYELYAVIVHRGTPYAGHYFSYIRDLTNEGNWNLTELPQFKSEPVKLENLEEKQILEEVAKDNTNPNNTAESNKESKKKKQHGNSQKPNTTNNKKKKNSIIQDKECNNLLIK